MYTGARTRAASPATIIQHLYILNMLKTINMIINTSRVSLTYAHIPSNEGMPLDLQRTFYDTMELDL